MGRARVRLFTILATLTGLAAAGPARAQAPASADGWVVLSVDEYRTLRERTLPRGAPPLTTVESTLTRVDYDLHTEGDAIAGRALLTIDVMRDGWTQVRIPPGLMVRDASLDGQPVSLVRGPAPHVLLNRAGRIVLALDIVLPLARNAGTDSIAIPASPSSISKATLVLPRGGIDVSVKGGFIAERAEDARQSRWTFYGRPNEAAVVAWKRKVEERRSEHLLRTRARVTQVVGLGEDVCQVAASIRVDVVQGLLSDVMVSVPPGLAVNRVDGATVGDWQLTGDRLRVTLLEPVTTDASFVVLGEAALPREGTIAVPLLRVPSAERETGGIAVDVVGAGEMAGRNTRGLDTADPTDLGDIVSGRESPSMIAFRLRPQPGTEPRSLTVDVVRYTPQAVLVANIEEARYRALATEDGRLLVEAQYAVRNNQRSFLKVSLPPGSTVWSASVAGRPTRPGGADADALLLPLDKGRASEEAPTFVVTLVYLQTTSAWPDKGRTHIELPAVDLPVSTTALQLQHSPRFDVTPEPGAFRVTIDGGAFAEAFRRPSSTALPSPPSTASGFETLINQFRSDTGLRTVTGSLPVAVAYPDIGPSLRLTAELTAEGRFPVLDLAVKRTAR